MAFYYFEMYEDELFYSYLCRYHKISGNPSVNHTIRDFYGKRISINRFYPNKLKLIYDNNKEFLNCSMEDIIYKHSFLRLYKPFLSSVKWIQILNYYLNGSDKDLMPSAKLLNSHSIKAYKYCKVCSSEDEERYGYKYIHSIHQIDGYNVCHKHKCALKTIDINFVETNNKLIDDSYINLNKNTNVFEMSDDIFNKFLRISNDISCLLERNNNDLNIEIIKNKYEAMMKKRGYITPKGVKQELFLQDFLNYYGIDFLNHLNIDSNESSFIHWINSINRVNNKRDYHPIKHILIINFLFQNMQNFIDFTIEESDTITITGLWPCLNVAASHYRQNVIKERVVKRCNDTGLLIAQYKCSCGYWYSKCINDNDDQYKARAILRFGETWEKELSNLLISKTYSIQGLGKKMRCSDVTIIRYAKKMGLEDCINTENNLEDKRKYFDEIKLEKWLLKLWRYKEDVYELLLKNPEFTRKELFVNLRKQYQWLYKNDKYFLNTILINKETTLVIDEKNQRKRKSDVADDEMLPIIKEIVLKIKYSKPPQPVNIYSVNKHIGKNIRFDRLPKCFSLLKNEAARDKYDYDLRRINYFIDNCDKSNVSFSVDSICRGAGIANCKRQNTINYIKEFLKTIDSNSSEQILALSDHSTSK